MKLLNIFDSFLLQQDYLVYVFVAFVVVVNYISAELLFSKSILMHRAFS